jgi:NADH-quinone oxidoreductase subunit B
LNNKVSLFKIDRLLNWAQANSLWYFQTGTACCADEVINSAGSRYDLERFGCLPQNDPSQADLLLLRGFISEKLADDVLAIYHEMREPRFVMAVGACACGGGLFSKKENYALKDPIQNRIPIDVFVPGCPPRPETIMEGLLKLQEKIRDH